MRLALYTVTFKTPKLPVTLLQRLSECSAAEHHQQLTALFNTDTVPALEALTTVVAASISATAAIITALENYLAATTLWQQETAYLVQSLHSSHQALGSIAAAYGFTIPNTTNPCRRKHQHQLHLPDRPKQQFRPAK